MSKGKRNKRKKRTPIQLERDFKRSCFDNNNQDQCNSGYYQVLVDNDTNIDSVKMDKKSSEASKVDTREQSYLAFDEDKNMKELLENMFSKFNTMLDEVRDINRKQDEILAKMTMLEDRVDEHDRDIEHLKQEVENINKHLNRDFDPEVTLVVTNPPRQAKGNPKAYSHDLIDAVGRPATIVNILHTEPRENSKGVLKIQLGSKEEKIDILRHKAKLKDNPAFRNVYIRSSKTHSDRIMDYNFKTMIAELIPDSASEYRIAGNGKLIKKKPTLSNHQSATGAHSSDFHSPRQTVKHSDIPSSRNESQRVHFAADLMKPKQGDHNVSAPETMRTLPPHSGMNQYPPMPQTGASKNTPDQFSQTRGPRMSQVETTPMSHNQSRPDAQMNFHDGSGNGSYSHTSHGTSPSLLQPTVPPYIPRHMSTHYSTPNLTQNALDGSTFY